MCYRLFELADQLNLVYGWLMAEEQRVNEFILPKENGMWSCKENIASQVNRWSQIAQRKLQKSKKLEDLFPKYFIS